MAKDSLETSDQFDMVEVRDDQHIRYQKPVEQDREDLAHMQVLKVRVEHEIDACTFDDRPLQRQFGLISLA